jgi:two-component system heavy metal sensor histidine kinase CusS
MIMGLVIHQLVMHHFEAQDRTQLEGKIQLIENLLEQNPSNSQELNLYLKDALVGHHDLIVQIERPTGQIIFSSAPSPFIPKHSINQNESLGLNGAFKIKPIVV